MDNAAIADVLDEVADLLELQGENPFRIRAYRNAARTVRSLPEHIIDVINDPDRRLSDLPGIGSDLEAKITKLAKSKTFPLIVQLRRTIPRRLRDLMRLPGLGPRKVMQLYRELSVSSIADLRAALEQGRVAHLKGFGKKTAENMRSGLALVSEGQGRIRLSEAGLVAQDLTDFMHKSPEIIKFVIAGSFRRYKETVGDLDLLAVSHNSKLVMDHLAKFSSIASIESRGSKKMVVRLKSGLHIDFRVVPEKSWGAALLYFTGSKAHNISLRVRAQSMGLKLNEYGVYRDGKMLAGRNEEDVYRALGLDWIPPELREDHGEIELAENHTLPRLVESTDIVGDLHIHTNATDGQDTLEAMIMAAVQKGYQYIAVTDHSQRVTMANGLDEDQVRGQWRLIDQLQKKYPAIRILKGIELDIREDGVLDLPNSLLEEADWVIAAIHYGLNQSSEQVTSRLLKAIKHPGVDAIAHPTGRLIGERPGYQADLDLIFKTAAEHRCALEINGQPSRLDLNDANLRRACKYPVKFVVNSDAHNTGELNFIQFAVSQARRAGLEKSRIVNANELDCFL